MWRELKESGLNRCVALRRLIKKKLQFAREHQEWTLEQWKRDMWSDESRSTLLQSDGLIIRREVAEVMHHL